MDLDELDHVVSARVPAWRAAGARWQIIRWPITDKPATSLRMEVADAVAELTLWVSGEAEMGHVRNIEEQPQWEHYEIKTALALNRCLDELEARVGL